MNLTKSSQKYHPIPREVEGTRVFHREDDVADICGEQWVTLIPEDTEDGRLWEFSLTTGKTLRVNSQ